MKNEDDFLDYEEAFHAKYKKDNRSLRKRAMQKDRSKYKISNIKQNQKDPLPKEKDEQKGLIIQVLPENKLVVELENHHQILCSFKGSMRFEKTLNRNLIAVGDFVHVKLLDKESGSITYVCERKSVLLRKESKQTQRNQILAANVDQVLITLSVLHPKLKPHLIDRYIIAAKEGNIQPVILFNKIDLLDPPFTENASAIKKVRKHVQELSKLYRSLGYVVLQLSAETGKNISRLKKQMRGKISVFSGQSGVGKTSLINALSGRQGKTHEVMKHSQKGVHTTTVAHLFPIDKEAYCIDTPGIKSFAMGNIDPTLLQTYFEEIATIAQQCRFKGCTHSHEPHCAVKEALQHGEISLHRYLSYCNLMGITPIQEEM